MPVYRVPEGQSAPDVADFAMGGVLGSAETGGKSIIRELMDNVKSFNLDPMEIFKAERATSFRVPPPNAIKAPAGFSLPGSMATSARSPELAKRASDQAEYFSKNGTSAEYTIPGCQ